MCGSGFVFGIRIRIQIRIQKTPEYGSNTDPDPQHCLHYCETVVHTYMDRGGHINAVPYMV